MSGNVVKRTVWSWIGWGLFTLIAIIDLMPLIWLTSSAFKPAKEIFTIPVTFWSDHFNLGNFVTSFTKWGIGKALLNSSIITFGTLIAQLLICSWCAFALATLRFKGRQMIFYVILATMMLPGFTMIVPGFQIARNLKLVNTFAGLIIPGAASAYGVFLLRQYFIKIPIDFFEAAFVDGANQLRIWWQVAMPLAKPALAALSIFTFLGVWRDLLWPVLILQKEELATLSIRIYFMNTFYSRDFGSIIASSFVVAIIPIMLFLVFQRQFIEGMTGGVKH
jgi:ABC-type glycerol-3-phosphate transport system permease component